MLVDVEVTRRPSHVVRAARRENMHDHMARWMADYCTLPAPKSILADKCEHGIYRGSTGGYCSGCQDLTIGRDQLVQWKGTVYRRTAGIELNKDGMPKKRSRRRFDIQIKTFTSPVSDEAKMKGQHNHESPGGYIRRGAIGIKAYKGWGPKSNTRTGAESFVNHIPTRVEIATSSSPTPVRTESRSWEYPDDPAFWSYVEHFKPITLPIVRRELSKSPQVNPQRQFWLFGQLICFESCKYSLSHGHPTIDNIPVSHRGPKGFWTAVDRFPKEQQKLRFEGLSAHRKECLERAGNVKGAWAGWPGYNWILFKYSDTDLKGWRNKHRGLLEYVSATEYYVRSLSPQIGKDAGRREPWCSCADCQQWFPNRKRSDDWRNDRTMRDLEARLHMFERDPKIRGDRLYRPQHIHRRVWELFRIATYRN